MGRKHVSNKLVNKISQKIRTENFMVRSKMNANSFLRKRKMPFDSLIFFTLNCSKKSTQIELTNYMDSFTLHKNISKSAYCQQRMNLKPEAFIELNGDLVDGYYEEADYKTWNGFRLIGIDGSTLMLPSSNKIREEFGVNSELNNVPMARISTSFDLLNDIIIDSNMSPNNISELDMAVSHIEKLKQGDLIIADRNYGARWLFYTTIKKKLDFVIRIQKGFGKECDDFWKSEQNSKIITINSLPKKSKKRISEISEFKFRLVKVVLPTGEIEVLATSLIDEIKYPDSIFEKLYFLRWNIETNYNHLKNHIEIGNFTGLTPHVIFQDFYSNVLISNLQSVIIKDAQSKLDEEKKQSKLKYKINKNLSLGYMKDRLIKILMNNSKDQYEKLVKLFLIEPLPIRKNRRFERNVKRHKRRFYMNQKRCI